MKYFITFLVLCILSILIGCGNEVKVSPISKPGTEKIITENILEEKTITTWDNVEVETYD